MYLVPDVDRDEAVSLMAAQDASRPGYSCMTICPKLQVTSVMQKDVRSSASAPVASYAALHVTRNGVRANRLPVGCSDVPLNSGQAKLACSLYHVRSPRSVRRTEVPNRSAGHIFKQVVGVA